MPDAPTTHRSRLAAAAAGVLGGVAMTALLLGAGPAPSIVPLQLAGNSDDVPGDLSGNCDEAEHAADPECAGTPTTGGGATSSTTSTTVGNTTSTTVGGTPGVPADEARSLDAAGAGTVVYVIDAGSLRLISATPASGWVVEVEQAAGREVELDFRSGTRRVQVNLEIEDGHVRERVRVRDDADDTDVRTEDGVIDDRDDDDNSGPGSGDDSSDDDSSDDDHSGSGHGGDDSSGDDSGGDDSSGHGSDD
jgi:hypothetical protein